ncbi:hypothetical protein B0H14DRAFT_2615843 [Mycena olivaceomarginata]|nr:hypothetical protein B0H14DRAFT_2615843 [Mycena olivaceomarginata]
MSQIAPRQRFLCKYLVENPPVRVGLVMKYLQSFQGDLYLLLMVVGILSTVDVSKATVISRMVFRQDYIMNLKFLQGESSASPPKDAAAGGQLPHGVYKVQNCKGLVLRDTLNISLVRVDLEQRFEYLANVDVVLLHPPLELMSEPKGQSESDAITPPFDALCPRGASVGRQYLNLFWAFCLPGDSWRQLGASTGGKGASNRFFGAALGHQGVTWDVAFEVAGRQSKFGGSSGGRLQTIWLNMTWLQVMDRGSCTIKFNIQVYLLTEELEFLQMVQDWEG